MSLAASDCWGRLEAALQRDDADGALTLFQGLLRVEPLPGQVVTWLHGGDDLFGWKHRDQLDLAKVRGDETTRLLVFARAAFATGFPKCALYAVRSARERAPLAPEPAFLHCAFLLRQGDPAAQALVQHCFAQFPAPSLGWSELGALLLARGQKKAALVCFGRGLPGFAAAMQRGLIARDLDQVGLARAAFEAATAFDPTSARAHFLQGSVAQDEGDLPAAAAAYRTVLALDPTVAEAAVNLGTVLQEAGNLEGARASYRVAVQTRPDTFGRIAQALPGTPKGELWLDLVALRRNLASG